MDEFTPCASANCSACAEVRRLRDTLARVVALRDRSLRQYGSMGVIGVLDLREALDNEDENE